MSRYKLGLKRIPFMIIGFFIFVGTMMISFGSEYDPNFAKKKTPLEFKSNTITLIENKEESSKRDKELQLILDQKIKELDEARKNGTKLKAPVYTPDYKDTYIKTRNKALGIKMDEPVGNKDKVPVVKKVGPKVDPEEIQGAQQTLVPTQNSYIKKKRYDEFDDTVDTYQGQ